MVGRVCDQINQDVGRHKRFRVEAVRWETHTVSALSERSQEAINEQLRDYEVYVGVMGYYFGSDTGRFLSGIEEEFEIALSRHSSSGAPKVQFYFSEAQVNPDNLNAEQFARVKAFRDKVGASGLLYKRFKDLVQLEVLVRKGIYDAVFNILEDEQRERKGEVPRKESLTYRELEPYETLKNLHAWFSEDPVVAIHYLIIDAIHRIDSYRARLVDSNGQVGKITRYFRASVRNIQLVGSGKRRDPKDGFRNLKAIDALDDYIYWLAHELSNIEDDFTVSVNAFQRAVLIMQTLPAADREEVAGALLALSDASRSLEELRSTCAQAAGNLEHLGGRFKGSARVYKALQADFADFLERAVSTIREVQKAVVPHVEQA